MGQKTKVICIFFIILLYEISRLFKKIKGFGSKTIITYNEYAMKLEYYDLDYRKLYTSLPDYSNNPMWIVVSAIKSYRHFYHIDF